MMPKNKWLCREHYKILSDLGFEISMYSLKELTDDRTGDPLFLFEIHGGFDEDINMSELLELLKILKCVKQTDSPAVKEAFEKLQTIVGITEHE